MSLRQQFGICLLVVLIAVLIAWSASELALRSERQDNDTNEVVAKEQIVNVSRIFMNQPGHEYTLLIDKPDTNESIERTIYAEVTAYIKDVPMDHKMWAELTTWQRTGRYTYKYATMVVHIHDVSDVEGGGWSRRENKRIINGTAIVVQ